MLNTTIIVLGIVKVPIFCPGTITHLILITLLLLTDLSIPIAHLITAITFRVPMTYKLSLLPHPGTASLPITPEVFTTSPVLIALPVNILYPPQYSFNLSYLTNLQYSQFTTTLLHPLFSPPPPSPPHFSRVRLTYPVSLITPFPCSTPFPIFVQPHRYSHLHLSLIIM